jgi:hypothetical protein
MEMPAKPAPLGLVGEFELQPTAATAAAKATNLIN